MKRIISLVLALVLALSLCACGSKDKGGETSAAAPAAAEQNAAPAAKAEAPAADTPAGYYKLREITSDGETETMEEFEQLGLSYYLVLEADGTGYIDMFGEKETVKWDDTGISGEELESASYTYADGVITITEGNDRLVFARLTDDELAYYKEHGSGSLEDLFGSFAAPDGITSDKEGAVGDYYVSFVGAEKTEDYEGKPALRYWYDFTNNSDKVTTAISALFTSAEQGGEDVSMAFAFGDDVPESDYEMLGVAPGKTIRCAGMLELDPEGGEITLKINDFSDSVTWTVDPKALPGAPADTFSFGTDADMSYMQSVPETGADVEILGVENGKDWNDNALVVVKYRYTNNSDQETSFYSAFTTFVMQDGYALEQAFVSEGGEEQDNMTTEVAPGSSVVCACGYVLRTDSPVAVIVKGYLTDNYFGSTFKLP